MVGKTSEKQHRPEAEGNSPAETGFAQNLDIIKDIKVTLSMEVGRTTLSIRDLLQLSQGSVIELNRMVDEPMEILVNGTLVAHGEVVMVDDRFGVRLTDVVSPAERVKRLK